jgi:predicted lipoprotein with Yx(FWY)xxD motif
MGHKRKFMGGLPALLLIGLVALAACSPAATAAPPTTAPTAAPAATSAPATVAPTAAATATTAPAITEAGLKLVQNGTLGSFLADGQGRTLYLFTKDSPDSTTCYDKCQQYWPPLLSLGQPQAGQGITTTLLATTKRKDGMLQVTYNGWPLYYYAKDKAASDTQGQAVDGTWWVVSAEGNPIKPAELDLGQNATLGKFLVDDTGRTLYLFTKDTPGVTVCYGKCEQAWPPLLTLGQPKLGAGVDQTLVGTAQRKDGTSQLTYNGWPLYYYYEDAGPGDVTGQAVQKVWWVISGEGNAIKPASLAVTQTTALGKFLADGAGRTLYLFTKDTKDTTTCYGKCEQSWAPLLQTDKPALGDGLDASLLGSTIRKDGTLQVTYGGWPLYYFAKDLKPGDTNGQGVGTVWYVIGPDGQRAKP